jgi:DNA-binding NarL/FixJ family response regulator
MPIRLLVVDDHPVVRAGVQQLLAGSDVEVVAEAGSSQQALDILRGTKVDLVLLDVRMPDDDGLRCLTEIKARQPQLPVLMFSGFANPSFIARAISQHASGYLTKEADRETLLATVRKAAAGGTVWSPDDHSRPLPDAVDEPGADSDIPLTRRECEVLQRLAQGLTNKQIADTLGISYETVKEHVQHILRKLGVKDRTQAAVWAVRLGIA